MPDNPVGGATTQSLVPLDTSFRERIEALAAESGARDMAIAVFDYETGQCFEYHASVAFHAASTIKVPILLGVFDALDQGRFTLETKVHIRNRFFSLVGSEIFHVSSVRDSNSKVHAARGKNLTIGELAHHMIVTSSNLATNLLLDTIGLERAKETLLRLGLTGIELHRGVEDERAHAQGIDNKVTATGLLRTFRIIEERRGISRTSSEKMLEILHQQEFRSGIPGRPSRFHKGGP